MSVTPGPYARPSASTRNGRSAAVPGSKTVSMWPMRITRGPPAAPRSVPTIVDPKRLAGSGRASTSAPMSDRNPATNRPTSSTPSGGAAAVDGRAARGRRGRRARPRGWRRRARSARRPRRRIRARSRSPRWAVYGPGALGILGGPCAWSRSACSRDPTSTGWRRWSRSRSGSAGGGPGTASASPGDTPWCGWGRRSRGRTGRARSDGWSIWRPRVDGGEGRRRRRPPFVGSGPLIVTFP